MLVLKVLSSNTFREGGVVSKRRYPNHSWMLVMPGLLILFGIVAYLFRLSRSHPVELGIALIVGLFAAIVYGVKRLRK